ncbi:MAG: dihydropteroate synthase [Gemmataceae bacterium]|nr:dihydropteroate synthase [Gemmataceae bacterium]
MHWQLRNRNLHFDSRCLVMGIVNVTPDSFSDGGRFLHTDAAIAHALELVRQGADLLDIGGESTRPGSQPITLEEELRRVVPVVAALAKQTGAAISVDTSKAEVARTCLEAGAHLINDITGLTGDPLMAETVRALGAGVVIMHMQGTPATMQLAPAYADVINDIVQYFTGRIQSLTALGIPAEALAIDPGIGFGKTREHNIALLAGLAKFTELGRPLCLGVSRKGFLGKMLDRPVAERLAGSLTAAAYGLAQNAVHILRVHDVAETYDLVRVWEVLRSAPLSPKGRGE